MRQTAGILIIFLGDSRYDARISNMIRSLKQNGRKVSVIDCPESWDVGKNDLVDRHWRVLAPMSLRFFIRYPLFIVQSVFALLFLKAPVIIASDLYSLVPSFSGSGRVVFDSREVYASLIPESGSKWSKKLLPFIEKRFIRKCAAVLVTGELDREVLEKNYGRLPVTVLKNLPWPSGKTVLPDIRQRFNIGNNPLLMYQGVLNPGRGLEKAIRIMEYLPSWHLVIAGGGVLERELKEQALHLGSSKIHFTGWLPYSELLEVSKTADIGWVFIEPVSESYRLALPNKLFEFIVNGVPVLATDLPAMRDVIESTGAGIIVRPDDKDRDLADQLRLLYQNREIYSNNCLIHRSRFMWPVQELSFLEAVKC